MSYSLSVKPPYEKLTSNHYFFLAKHTEAKLKTFRTRINANDLQNLDTELFQTLALLEQCAQELDSLKSSM